MVVIWVFTVYVILFFCVFTTYTVLRWVVCKEQASDGWHWSSRQLSTMVSAGTSIGPSAPWLSASSLCQLRLPYYFEMSWKFSIVPKHVFTLPQKISTLSLSQKKGNCFEILLIQLQPLNFFGLLSICTSKIFIKNLKRSSFKDFIKMVASHFKHKTGY